MLLRLYLIRNTFVSNQFITQLKQKTMKKTFTITAILLLAFTGAMAQAPYALTTYTMTYTPLSGATLASGTTPWGNQGTMFYIPMPFPAKMGGVTIPHTAVWDNGGDMFSDTSGTMDMFQNVYTPFNTDRGQGTGISKSPIRYTTTGTSPNRIFKIEDFNLGFEVDKDTFGTLNDSFSTQFWIYETSNIIEIHYGDHKINPVYAHKYFGSNHNVCDSPGFVGYFHDLTGTTVGWFASADPTNATLDSFKPGTPFYPNYTTPLWYFPPSGTVYRFTPASILETGTVADKISSVVYPTVCSGLLNVKYEETGSAAYTIFSVKGVNTGISGELKQGNNTIDASHLPSGMYLVKLQTGSQMEVCKFIKR